MSRYGEAISPRGDSRKIAPSFFCWRAHHVVIQHHLVGQALASDRRASPPRGGRWCAAEEESSPTLASFPAPSVVPTRRCRPALLIRGAFRRRGLRKWSGDSARAWRPGCVTPAHRRPRFFSAAMPRGRKRACRWCPKTNCPRAIRGAHGLGDALTAENRSHRLRLAHPPLRRSGSRVPLRLAGGGAVGRRAFQRRAVRCRRGFLEPPRRPLHLRHDARRTGASNRAAREACGDRERRRHGAPRPGARSGGYSPPRLDCRACIDDLEQLAAGMTLYDAFYRWARDASDETHDWPTNKPGKRA